MNLRRQLKKSFSIITEAGKKSGVSRWVTDNYYVIHKHYKTALTDKNALRCPMMYSVLEKYCRQQDYLPEKDTLVNYLKNQKVSFSYNQLSSVKTLLSVCAINKIAELLEFDEQSGMIGNSVKLLLNLSNPDFDEILPLIWRCEKQLSKAEPDFYRFDDSTKEKYRSYIYNKAKKQKIGELDALERLADEANRKGVPLGKIIYSPDKKYTALWILSCLLFLSLFVFLGAKTIGWLTVCVIVPLCLASASIADQILAFKTPVFRAPRIKIEKIPNNAKTLVTVAVLMNGGKGDSKVFADLEKFYFLNRDKNIYFCVLADFPDSKTQFHLEDAEIIQTARGYIDRLNQKYGDRFCLYFRERVKNPTEDRFGGWERKRGAVCELVSHIKKGNKTEYYGSDFIRDIKYILTLDSDTNLSLESVKEMVSVALHPANAPIVKNNRVVSGYGIIQPVVRTELKSAYSSGFSRLVSGSGGADVYASAFFQRSQWIFGSGNFCGKGLIDVDLFHSCINGKLPEGLVLSHDVIEGSIIRTLSVSDITLTDSTPSNTVSFFRRLHRWIRGDFQNLWFLKSKLISGFSKTRLIATVLRHSSAVFSLLAVIIGCFLKDTNGLWIFVFAYSEFLFPTVLSVTRFLLSGHPFACVRFFSKGASMLSQTFLRLFFEISSSCRKAVLTLNAFCLSFWRLITRKKTLEWTTAAQTEKLSSTLGKYVLDSFMSMAIGLSIMILANPPFIKLVGLLYFVYPLVSAVLSRSLEESLESVPKLTEKQKNTLVQHANDMLDFYFDNVGEKTNYLPPDNIQFSPVKSVALRTSPTNIGFYLVSLLASRDLNKITSSWLYNRLDNSLTTIEKLEKYKGNLFNWYSLTDLSVIGQRYVSFVDSGNFIVMLSVLKEGLKEYYGEEPILEEISQRCQKLIGDCDLSCFYDSRRNLFKIGVNEGNESDETNCYDLLMSEARMSSYFAVAKGIVPKKHWQSLGRLLTHKYGYLGMKSWSGTAFEYLMPQLFLPLYRDSFLYESVAFSLMIQRSENSVWGVSESGFYAFDSEMNYQYKANGIQPLALRRIEKNESVISPYSTYLSLCVYGNIAVKNLNALENLGMYGKYGLYEALDRNNNSGGVFVKSYMAHHIGMSIVAILNAVKDNIFVKRLLSDNALSASVELLQEKIPTDAHIFDDDYEKTRKIPQTRAYLSVQTQKTELESPTTALISRGDMTAIISSSGHIGLNCGDRLIANTVYDLENISFSPSVIFTSGDKHFSCVPLTGGNGVFGFEKGEGKAYHIVSGKDFSGRVKYSFSKNANCFIVNTRAEALKKYNITFAFEPVLESKKKYLSHISFSRLFIECEYDEAKRILYFHRRSGLDGRHIFTLGVAPRDKDMKFSFLTSREDWKTASFSSVIDYGKAVTDNKTDECIDPLCLVRSEDCEGGKATFLLTVGETKSQCEKNIRLARHDKSEFVFQNNTEIIDEILPKLLYNRRIIKTDKFSDYSIGDLWSRRISGDYPMVAVELKSIAENRTRELLESYWILKNASIHTELVFIINEKEGYFRPIENSVKTIINDMNLSQYINRNGGIFIISKKENIGFAEMIKKSACCFIDFSFEAVTKPNNIDLREIIETPKELGVFNLPAEAIPSVNGDFIEKGFVVDKIPLPSAPYSYILTGKRFSTVVTQSSLGYTFFDNAREQRICAFNGDSKALYNGERIFAILNNKKYDLCAIAQRVKFEKGNAQYFGTLGDVDYVLKVTVNPEYPIKLIYVAYKNAVSVETVFEIKPIMGDLALPFDSIETKDYFNTQNQGFLFKNPFGMTFPDGVGFAGVCDGTSDGEGCRLSCVSGECLFFLGAGMSEGGALKTANRVNRKFFEASLNQADEFAESMLPPIKVKTKSKATDMLINYFLPYQVSACRFYARGSFYQSGGAYGFRDQLQDCLALIYSNPKAVRTHIIRCTAHQYLDGSVMHWWHTRKYGNVNRGIKSKCSDDMLYLPLVAADYIEKTGDYSLLEVETAYLSSPPLDNIAERYEQPEMTMEKETVYFHCLRALSYAEKRGKNGLLLMGSCDWNDAFSLVGVKGRGESIFTTLLFVIVAEKFIPIIEKQGDFETASHYRNIIEELKQSVEEKAFFGDRYARAFCDDGSVLGIEECEECKIDILSQAFAFMAGLNPERTKTALNTAFSKLYDNENRIFKLFSPPFANGDLVVGYIRGYISGVRENGGQYSHGALWGALACIKAGLYEEGLLILDCVNPATRCNNKKLADKYKNEPYAVSADIYSGARSGRGGWSWYTGAASWFYKIMIENVLGLRFGANQALIDAKPIIPFEAEIKWGNSELTIISSDKISKPLLNQKKISFPLSLPDGKSVIELPLKIIERKP